MPGSGRNGERGETMKSNKMLRVLNYLFVALMLIVSLFPIYWMLNTSLKSQGEIYAKIPTMYPHKFSLEAYRYLLTETSFVSGLKNSLIIAVFVSAFSILVAYPAAYAIARIKFKGRRMYSKTVLFTYLLPTCVLYIPLYMFVSTLKLSNSIYGLMLIYPTFTLPYVAWILIPHIASVPVELEEAARVDGCSRIGTMYRIVFPLALPGIISTTIFAFAMCWGEYLYALVNVSSKEVQTFPLILSAIIYGDMPAWNQLMAGAIVACIPILCIYILSNSALVGGKTAGGVKQ